MHSSLSTPKVVEHFFRHEYGKLVASLSCRVGVRYSEDVEDAVQSALMTALETWTNSGQPDNPSAWLFRVASNNLIGGLRQKTSRSRLLEKNSIADTSTADSAPNAFYEGEMRDDLLRMLFACCDEAIPRVSQLVLALKVLCGFDVREISIRLFTSEANVYKRLGRARERLRELEFSPGELNAEQFESRLPSVHTVLYLLFTEGYQSSHSEMAIRRELCGEAIRLATLFSRTPRRRDPGNVCSAGVDAPAHGTADFPSGPIRRLALVGGAEPGTLGPSRNPNRLELVGQSLKWRRLFSLPCRSGDRRRALPGTFV